jgi:hypothetical protein
MVIVSPPLSATASRPGSATVRSFVPRKWHEVSPWRLPPSEPMAKLQFGPSRLPATMVFRKSTEVLGWIGKLIDPISPPAPLAIGELLPTIVEFDTRTPASASA